MKARLGWILCVLFLTATATRADLSPIQYEKETLDNGLRVIYAPLHQAPVVHVRVLYHVGSRDERPDRQGFAHMFEHMMFRGSAHVAPEQHMKMIGVAGGNSNAFTSFDQTTYVNTIPSNAVEMALYLEADRMASFKVNDNIFQTERKVVAEEWRMRYGNQPLGSLYQDFTGLAFKKHSYHWTPIGDMDQLRQASSSELQKFYNTYYVPDNACLIVAGDIDIAKTKQWVHQYFGWIPRSSNGVPRVAEAEPEQTEARKLVVNKPNVPLTNIYMGFKTTDFKSDDHYALDVLGDILGSGQTSRLERKFVNGDSPVCLSTGAGDQRLEDQSLFVVNAVVQHGNDPDQVEKDMLAAVYDVAEKGVTQDELDKVRTQSRQARIRRRETCTQIATQLGEEEVFGGNADRVNTEMAKYDALTPADIQAAAKKYLRPEHLTIVQYRPDPTGINARKAAATQAAEIAAKADQVKNAAVVASKEVVAPRVKDFPAGYPTDPPVNNGAIQVTLDKGVEDSIDGITLITLTDHRLPLVQVSLVMKSGGDAEPADKVGLAGMAAQMLRRGSEGMSFLDLSSDLESRGISIEASDGGDTTRFSVSCTTDQLDHAISRGNLILTQPTFPVDEFEKLRRRSVGGLIQSLASPANVATRELAENLYEGGPQGRVMVPKDLLSLSLDDVKKWYQSTYQRDGAMVVISGDITPERGKEVAQKLLAGFDRKGTPPAADYSLKPAPGSRRIILVDNPDGKQATVRMAIRAYDIHTDEKFAGSVAGQILSAGIESRLNKYVRAEKGLTYGCSASFRPGRHSGEFSGSVDTNPDTTSDAIEAMLKVYDDMKAADVSSQELAEAKSRVAGGAVMELQTIAAQAQRRIEQILNGYPIDYYDKYPQRIAEVQAPQVRDVMDKYVKDDQLIIVVVAPASIVKSQLEKLGTVEVIPMPLRRPGILPDAMSGIPMPATRPGEMLKPAS
ncbi:MAG TPA: pitrilysin family protein [Tepidisphaeraceae bacterium]